MGFPCKRVRHKIKHNQHQSTVLTNDVNRSPNHDIISVFLQNTNQRHKNCCNVNRCDKRENHSKISSVIDDDSDDDYYIDDAVDDEDEESSFNKFDDAARNRAAKKKIDDNRNSSYSNNRNNNIDRKPQLEEIAPIQRQKLLQNIGSHTITRLTQLISFKRKNSRKTTSPPSSIHAATTAIAPTNTKINTTITTTNTTTNNNNNNLNNNNNNNNNIRNYNRSHNNENNSIITNSQYFIRQSVCLYAASGFLIALCYLAVPAAASIDSLHPM